VGEIVLLAQVILWLKMLAKAAKKMTIERIRARRANQGASSRWS
jgi:hypothetical protein